MLYIFSVWFSVTAITFKKALQWSAFFVCLQVFVVSSAEIGTVSYVIDGDTVILESGMRVRMIGINAPEKESETRIADPYALEARLALIELVEGVAVKVIAGEEKFDRYGRLLAYLQLQDGTDVQASIVARGYAAVIAFPPNIDRISRYQAIESVARSKKLGIWGNPDTIVELDRHDRQINTGFQVITGRVTGVKYSKRYKQLLFGDKLRVLISLDSWEEFWRNQTLENYIGKEVETRGWITGGRAHKRLVVRHPSMITVK